MSGVEQIDVMEAQARQARGVLLVDVREAHEWATARAPGATWLPISAFQQRWQELPTDKPIMFMCAVGGRSQMAAQYVQNQGLRDVSNVHGGMTAWVRAGLPTEQDN